jgi:zinc transporter, ZIP family
MQRPVARSESEMKLTGRSIPLWLTVLLPLGALALLLSVFASGSPLALLRSNIPPPEELTFERVLVTQDGFRVTLINGGPVPVTVTQVQIDQAYWSFMITPSNTIPRLGHAQIVIEYPWVTGEPNLIRVVTSTGLTFESRVEAAVATPVPGLRQFLAYGLVGVYVGVVPVVLGMLWYPAMRRLKRELLGAILSLTIGLLVFLLIDTLLEGLEVGGELPGAFQGVPLLLFAFLLAWLVILAVGSSGRGPTADDPAKARLYLAGLIALGIGLHNLGEGLAIGAAFAVGAAALGSFLVVGFTLHNITEGIGIVAPLVPSRPEDAEAELTPADQASPRWTRFAGLALLAGAPAIVGTWIGGFAFSPVLATIFLGLGAGAIWQVIVEVGRLLQRQGKREGAPLVSWLNLAGFLAGLAIMYLTAFLVKV